MSFDNYLLILTVIGFGVVASLVFFATRNGKIFEDFMEKLVDKTQDKEIDNEKVEKKASIPVKRNKTGLKIENLEKLKSDLRILDIEREIVGYAITRLYEAEAEEKITDEDRSQLLNKYKDAMKRLDEEIEKKQAVVKLHDLEETKANLVEMFQSKLDEINRNIEGLKSSLGLPFKTTQIKTQPTQPAETTHNKIEGIKNRNKSALKVREKSNAEERIEAIQEEVLKVLERLEKIEMEGELEENELNERSEEESSDRVGQTS